MHSLPGGELPSVGKIELAWVQQPLPPVNVPSPVVKTEDTAMDEGDAMATNSSPAHGSHENREQSGNLDYDVADDDEWGTIS